jgi:hypothetical protein
MQQVLVRSQENRCSHFFQYTCFPLKKNGVIPAIVSSGSLKSAFSDGLISDRDPLALLVFVTPPNLLNLASCLYSCSSP